MTDSEPDGPGPDRPDATRNVPTPKERRRLPPAAPRVLKYARHRAAQDQTARAPLDEQVAARLRPCTVPGAVMPTHEEILAALAGPGVWPRGPGPGALRPPRDSPARAWPVSDAQPPGSPGSAKSATGRQGRRRGERR